MDGVLVDGEPLHFAAVNQLLAEEGRSLTLDEYRPYMGTKSGWVELIRDLGLRFEAPHYAPRYNDLILRQYTAQYIGEWNGLGFEWPQVEVFTEPPVGLVSVEDGQELLLAEGVGHGGRVRGEWVRA